MPSLRSSLIRLAHQRPSLRPHLLPLFKSARLTEELIRVKYVNLGDFGGTDPVEDSWFLEVAGPTFDYRDDLKRLGFRWNSARKTWSIDATLYKYGGRRNADFYKNRKLQEAAYPVVQALAKKHNEAAEAYNKGLRGGDDLRGVVERWKRVERMGPKLTAAGLKIEHTHPGRYDVTEGTVTVSGNTFPLVAIMRKHGWKWNQSKRAWEIPVPEFSVIQDKWMGDVVRELPSRPEPVVSAVFSEMSQRDLADWVGSHFDYEDLTNDGEQDAKVGIARYMTYLKGLTPEKQQSFYEKRNRLYGR